MINSFRGRGLWAILIIQALCAAFFLADGLIDLLGFGDRIGFKATDQFEYLIAIALIVGLAVTVLEIRKMQDRQRRMGNQLKVASGAFAELLEEHYDGWDLTPSERDIALLSLKGLSIAHIAELRNTKEGTVKAQLAAIYRKAGVNGRPQLMSLFIEELLAESLSERSGQTP